MALVDIVGCGPGDPSLLTARAREAVGKADVLFGAKRLLEMFPSFKGRKIPLESTYQRILDSIEREMERHRVVVLVTGDVGFHSFASLVVRRIGRERCRLHSGISSVQYAFNRLCLSWEDALFLSSHGEEIREKRRTIRSHPKVGIVTGGENGVQTLFQGLDSKLFEVKRVFVLENLSLPDERVREIRSLAEAEGSFSSLSVVIIVDRTLYA
jgi:precorrin-6y C5,15-methyltransferase (decarboxylating) CbiE subunit